MTILSYGAQSVQSQVWQRFCWQATQCAVTGLGHKTVSKILWTTCLTSLLVQENIPSCCFFPYLELHCYHHLSHMGLYIILLEASDTHLTVASIYQNIPISLGKSQRLSHGQRKPWPNHLMFLVSFAPISIYKHKSAQLHCFENKMWRGWNLNSAFFSQIMKSLLHNFKMNWHCCLTSNI